MNLFKAYEANKDVIMVKHPQMDLYSVKYKNLGVDFSNELTRLARGIIITSSGEIIARPFVKFFNLFEMQNRSQEWNDKKPESLKALSMPEDLPFEATEKLDGSLIIVYEYMGELMFSSSGSVESEHSKAAKALAYELFTESQLEELKSAAKAKYTIMFEYTAPENHIVVHYVKPELRVIGVNETNTGKDLSREEVDALLPGLPKAKLLTEIKTLEEAQDYIANTKGIEGLVIRYSNGKRIKMKTEEYFELHKTASILTVKEPYAKSNYEAIINFIVDGNDGDIDDLLTSSAYKYASDSFLTAVEEIRALITLKVQAYNEFSMNPDPILEMLDTSSLYMKDVAEEIAPGISRYFLSTFSKQLAAFHQQQGEYFAVNQAVRSTKTRRGELIKALGSIYGTRANYQHKITAKSFAFKEFDLKAYLLGSVEKLDNLKLL